MCIYTFLVPKGPFYAATYGEKFFRESWKTAR